MVVDIRYYKVREAAETLGVDEEQVLDFIHTGKIKAVNVAKDENGKRPRWRIPEGELGRFVLSRLHPAGLSQPSAPAIAKRPKPKKQHV